MKWLLKFAARDLAQLSPAARKAAWDTLFTAQSGQPVRVPVKASALAETHTELCAAIEALANEQAYNLWVPVMSWTLHPPPHADRRRPVGAPPSRESRSRRRS